LPILQGDVLALKIACHSDEESGRMFGHWEVLKNAMESSSFALYTLNFMRLIIRQDGLWVIYRHIFKLIKINVIKLWGWSGVIGAQVNMTSIFHESRNFLFFY
jgi:hypothetical protein